MKAAVEEGPQKFLRGGEKQFSGVLFIEDDFPAKHKTEEYIYAQRAKDRKDGRKGAREAHYIRVPNGWVCRKNGDTVDTAREYITFEYMQQQVRSRGVVIGTSETSRDRVTTCTSARLSTPGHLGNKTL